MATILTWAIQAASNPAHTARFIATALLNEGVVDKAGNSFKVAQDTGSNMAVKVGSGSAGDLVVVEGDNSVAQGTYIAEHQDATATLVIAASDPSNPRIDRIVVRVDDAEEGGVDDVTDIEVVQGTPAGSPSAPAVPSSAISVAQVAVGAGVTAITNANITDERVEAPVRGQFVETVQFTTSGSFVKADYPYLAKVLAKVQAGGGAGGGATTTSAGEASAGDGGGGGGYAEALVLVDALSASTTVTVGAGGAGVSGAAGGSGTASSFGSHAAANGGGGGSIRAATATPSVASSDTSLRRGGVGTAGDILHEGGSGGHLVYVGSALQSVIGGHGGASHFNGGRSAPIAGGNGAGGGQYGGGGTGAANHANQGSARTGGAGAGGIIILDLYA
jgi:hypothetical protein